MAGLKFSITTDDGLTTGTQRMTALQLRTPAAGNQRGEVERMYVDFGGTDPTAAKILVEVVQQSTNGTGGTAVTPKKRRTSDPETVQSTARQHMDPTASAYVAPTDTAVIERRKVDPTGFWEYFPPKGREQEVQGGKNLAIVVTAAVNTPFTAGMDCAE